MTKKTRASRNRTMTLTEAEQDELSGRFLTLTQPTTVSTILDRTICQDIFTVLGYLPEQSIDLIFADPPYNMRKSFNGRAFTALALDKYEGWLDSWVSQLPRILKPTASIYICGDWRSSAAIHRVMSRYFTVRNRITWEREKGRGAKANWKNASEDIWFGTLSNDYTFNIEAVKVKRRVMAPYTQQNGKPKDWDDEKSGRFRLTHPSNIWTDLTVPFWSMPENTDHPTQKPEKLLAKIILANSNEGDLVFDPFLGSGTTSVVARKLNRHFVGVEIDRYYASLTEKRLDLAQQNPTIQGYTDGVFWERNTLAQQKRARG